MCRGCDQASSGIKNTKRIADHVLDGLQNLRHLAAVQHQLRHLLQPLLQQKHVAGLQGNDLLHDLPHHIGENRRFRKLEQRQAVCFGTLYNLQGDVFDEPLGLDP
ncbi:hypothetical protein D3C87_1851870 [compost metagenome]